MFKIAAVIVKYGQYNQVLLDNLSILAEIGVDIFLVENSNFYEPSCNALNVKYIHNRNINGLAGGLNVGIKSAMAGGAEFVFLLDQDTVLDFEMLDKYFSESLRVLADDENACCGPSFIDLKFGKKHGFANYGFLKINSIPSDDSTVSCLYLMTSGTMIRADVFDVVGLMDESLFIDYVDVEWCLRARGMGYKVIGLSRFEFLHNVGDYVKNILWFTVPVHSKFRLYFQVRNLVYLTRRKHMPFYWKLCESIYGIKRAVFYCLIGFGNFFTMLKGLRDGFK
jgi:rhamnosyltransferase